MGEFDIEKHMSEWAYGTVRRSGGIWLWSAPSKDERVNLQVGDVIVKDEVRTHSWAQLRVVGLRQNYIKVDTGASYLWISVSDALWNMKKVHRPTPSGLVQVWPEVEGAKPTFEKALEATIDKYGDALARLAGTQDVQHDPD